MPSALVIGASRSIGLALATGLAARGWDVIGTVRGSATDAPAALSDVARVERLDITDREQLEALHARLAGTTLDLLFVNAGRTNENVPVAEVPTAEFVDVMVTNALSPLLVIEGLGPLVAPDGTIAVMSSRQGSVSMNERGGHEVYRASKSALNQLMRSYAARHRDDPRTLLLMHPGWVQTELGGAGAELTVEESARGVLDTVLTHAHDGGLQFLDHRGDSVAW